MISQQHKRIHYVTALRWFDPFSPIALIIGHGFGISYYEMFVLQAIFSTINLITELPAGIIADRYGRGYAITISSIFLTIAYLIFMLDPSFITWAVAEVFAGIGIAFYSGADTALLYESCEQHEGSFYHKQEGLMQAVARLSEGLSSGLGFVAIINPRMPIVLAWIAKVLLLALCWTSFSSKSESARRKISRNKSSKHMNMMGILKALGKDRIQRPQQFKILSTIFLYAATQSIVLINIFWMIQVTASMHALTLTATSMLWVFYFTLGGMTSYFLSSRLRPYWQGQVIALPAISCVLLYAALSISSAYRWIPLVMFSVMHGLSIPLINGLINHHTIKERRVMMHSVNTTLTRFLFVLIVPIIGYLTDYVSSEAGFTALLLITSLCFLLSIRIVRIAK